MDALWHLILKIKGCLAHRILLLRYLHARTRHSIAPAAPAPKAMAPTPAVLAKDAGDSGAAGWERHRALLEMPQMDAMGAGPYGALSDSITDRLAGVASCGVYAGRELPGSVLRRRIGHNLGHCRWNSNR